MSSFVIVYDYLSTFILYNLMTLKKIGWWKSGVCFMVKYLNGLILCPANKGSVCHWTASYTVNNHRNVLEQFLGSNVAQVFTIWWATTLQWLDQLYQCKHNWYQWKRLIEVLVLHITLLFILSMRHSSNRHIL